MSIFSSRTYSSEAPFNNAVVVDGDVVLNADGLRYQDEFVRHKLLDSIGDLYLAGMPIIGHFRGYKTGHILNQCLLIKLFSSPDSWSYVNLADLDQTQSTSMSNFASLGADRKKRFQLITHS